jgi:hypothetical protein
MQAFKIITNRGFSPGLLPSQPDCVYKKMKIQEPSENEIALAIIHPYERESNENHSSGA